MKKKKSDTRKNKNGTNANDAITTSLKQLITYGKNKGFLSTKDVHTVFSPEIVPLEIIEDALASIERAGITILNHDNDHEEDGILTIKDEGDIEDKSSEESSIVTDDPVRMYLKDMGGVNLLSRAGEIEIAKRIEKGKKDILTSLCEAPSSMHKFIALYEDLVNGRVLLRTIVDLEALGGKDELQEDLEGDDKLTENESEIDGETETTEDESDETNPSLLAIESALLPSVIEMFAEISKLCEKILGTKITSPKYLKMVLELIEKIREVHINDITIENIVNSLYAHNKKISHLEQEFLKLAEKNGISRKEFLSKFTDLSTETLSALKKQPNWEKFINSNPKLIKEIQKNLHTIEEEVGVTIPHFKKLVLVVQKGRTRNKQSQKRHGRS